MKNKTIARNQLIGNLAAVEESWNSYGKNLRLCDLPEREFTTGTHIAAALKKAGFTESPKTVIGQNNWWSLTVKEFTQAVLEAAE